MAVIEDRYEWRYLPTGKVAHALVKAADSVAVCGMGPWWSSAWMGTGSQDEYERVAALPRCRRCLRQIA